jgi:plastocyanin
MTSVIPSAARDLLLGSIPGLMLAVTATAQPSNPGRTHEIRMQGGRFAPYEITIQPGDTVRFVLGTGGPHNVAFRETTGEAATRLRRRMTDTIADLAGPLLVVPGETYTVVFTDVPAGRYPYWCIPHLAMGQMGEIRVR